MPDSDDCDEEPPPHSPSPGQKVQALIGGIAGWVVLGLFLLIWAADFASCFKRSDPATKDHLVPRPPNVEDPQEFRLVTRLENMWMVAEGLPDSATVWVIDDSSVNAASMGNGTFVAWRGLVDLPDAEIDAVYAHEIAHDRLSHARKAAELRDVTDFVGEALGSFAGSDETAAVLKRWTGAFVVPHYSRQQELEADQEAVTLLSASGYPEAAATLCLAFVHLRDSEGEAGGGFFSSHPALSERINAIRLHDPSADTADDCR